MKRPDQYSNKNMIAKDLFESNLIQVFSKKKGDWLGTLKVGDKIEIEEVEFLVQEEKAVNKNQLVLF